MKIEERMQKLETVKNYGKMKRIAWAAVLEMNFRANGDISALGSFIQSQCIHFCVPFKHMFDEFSAEFLQTDKNVQ